MDDEKKLRLESRLRAIQELKEEQYVGTGQAFGYIKAVASLYENPIRIARDTNLALGDNITYEATPAKILGVCSTIENIFKDAELNNQNAFFAAEGIQLDDDVPQEVHEKYLKYYKEYLDDGFDFRFYENPILNWKQYIIGGDDNNDNKLEVLTEYMIQLFREMHEECDEQIEDKNELFGRISVDSVAEQASVPNEIRAIVREEMYFSGVDWTNCLSIYNLSNIERKEKIALSDSFMSYYGQFAKMERDLVLGRFDYRRQVVVKYLQDYQFENFEEACEKTEERLEESEERLKELISLHSPVEIIKNEEYSIRCRKFLIRTLHQEKNFLRRFLKS